MLGGSLTVRSRRSITLGCRDYRAACRGVERLEFAGDVRASGLVDDLGDVMRGQFSDSAADVVRGAGQSGRGDTLPAAGRQAAVSARLSAMR
jgi:hypothetical protein